MIVQFPCKHTDGFMALMRNYGAAKSIHDLDFFRSAIQDFLNRGWITSDEAEELKAEDERARLSKAASL